MEAEKEVHMDLRLEHQNIDEYQVNGVEVVEVAGVDNFVNNAVVSEIEFFLYHERNTDAEVNNFVKMNDDCDDDCPRMKHIDGCMRMDGNCGDDCPCIHDMKVERNGRVE